MLLNEIKPRTKSELVRLQKLLTTAKTFEEAKASFPEELLIFFEAEMKNKNQNFENISKDIKVYLSNMKDIKLYMSFEPSKLLLSKILHAFDIQETDRYVEVICDESLVGGIKVVMDGKMYDETIDRSIYEKCL